jgi:hypothetical protein
LRAYTEALVNESMQVQQHPEIGAITQVLKSFGGVFYCEFCNGVVLKDIVVDGTV